MTSGHPHKWHNWLSLAEWWYNATYHTATKRTPYEAIYGVPPPLHIAYFLGNSIVAVVDNHLFERELMIKDLQFELQQTQALSNRYANQRQSEREFNEGDWAFLKAHPYKQHFLALWNQSSLLQSTLAHS